MSGISLAIAYLDAWMTAIAILKHYPVRIAKDIIHYGQMGHVTFVGKDESVSIRGTTMLVLVEFDEPTASEIESMFFDPQWLEPLAQPQLSLIPELALA